MEQCIFCKLLRKEIPSNPLYEDEHVIVVEDLYPKAPIHVLVIPKVHIESIAQMTIHDELLVGHMHRVAAKVAKEHYQLPGFKVLFNVNKEGGQEIMHIHLHVLGKAPLDFPTV